MDATITAPAKPVKTKKKPAPPPEPAITSAYLMWVGSDSYPGIKDWAEEALEMGISKRLPSVDAGKALMRPGVAVFVAHDEGETTACSHCVGSVECPDCRKRAVERASLQEAIDNVRRRHVPREAAEASDYTGWELMAPDGDQRYVALREAKITQLDERDAACPVCEGRASVETGTGGYVLLDDGDVWDYRRYNYWLHQPTKFDPSLVVEKHMCANCGGTGEMPNAMVFGVFVPERIEYIMSGDEDEDKLEAVKDFAAVETAELVVEKKRKCGKRHPGGVYVVTTTEGAPAAAHKALGELVEKGLVEPEGTEVHGSFIRFARPIPVAEKRFRGIKGVDVSILGSALAPDVADVVDALKA